MRPYNTCWLIIRRRNNLFKRVYINKIGDLYNYSRLYKNEKLE